VKLYDIMILDDLILM